ncbi:DNA primase TraC [Methyloligella halotolerans]|uniref:DNA primase TraC n=1 Tax=Methyloligella halotolerans TaxID=1177755 RepID=A0A1E2RUZ7_9HYPH|nr:zincin-like metallopeptidase domain-containing protein [Methyloligella halotolerans]ODA66033.1 DNA primase TraC [Methyloligella halotolerans]
MSISRKSNGRRDLHAEITEKLIAAIEADPGEPQLPWRKSSGPLSMPVNAQTGNAYNGINVIALWVAAELRHFTTPIWATYRQWAEKGAQVRKGEKAATVIFYKEYRADPDPEDESDDGSRRVARASAVFNADQVDGVAIPSPEPSLASLGPVERIGSAERLVGASGARIEHGGQRAFYSPSTDHIQMPDENLFCGTDTMTRHEAYHAVLLHELVHWTGGKSRLDRQFAKRFGTKAYAAEELVAEIGSAFLCSELGVTQDTRPDHSKYLSSWLELLKHDNRAIFTAAAKRPKPSPG